MGRHQASSVRPEEHLATLASHPPVSDYRLVAKRGEDPSSLRPAGESFPHRVSVIMLTLNEEVNIARALHSVSGSGDVIVLDSGSADRTREIAAEAGARVLEREFVTSAAQRQWALDNIEFANPWIFVLDADEWVPLALAEELSDVIGDSQANPFAAAWCRTRIVYEGRWIPRSTLYPSWTMRLLRKGRARYEQRATNAHAHATGSNIRLESDLIHEDLKSLCNRIRKLDRYARLEALETLSWTRDPRSALRTAPNRRRRLKILHSLVPMRALSKGIALLLRGGVFEGRPGLHFIEDCFFQERLTVRYLHELQSRAGLQR